MLGLKWILKSKASDMGLENNCKSNDLLINIKCLRKKLEIGSQKVDLGITQFLMKGKTKFLMKRKNQIFNESQVPEER